MLFDGPAELQRQARSRNARIVGDERHRHAVLEKHPQRVARSLDPEDQVVAGEGNLNQHAPGRHLSQQPKRVVFIHHAATVPDAPRMPGAHRLANVEPKRLRRDEPLDELARVKSDLDAGILGMQEVEHCHLLREIAKRRRIIFGLHEIEPDEARVLGRDLETGEHLREHLLGDACPAYLRDVTHDDATARIGIARAAAEQRALSRLGDVEAPPGFSNDVLEAAREQAIALPAEIRIPAGRTPALRRRAAVGGQHQLEVADPLGGRARDDLGDHVPRLVGRRAELSKRRKEVIVAVERGVPMPHRHRVDGLIEQCRVAQDGGDGWLTGGRVTSGRDQRHRRRGETEAVLGGPAQVALGVDRARQVVVQVPALGHLGEKREQQQRLVADRREVSRRGGFAGGGRLQPRSGSRNEQRRPCRYHDQWMALKMSGCHGAGGVPGTITCRRVDCRSSVHWPAPAARSVATASYCVTGLWSLAVAARRTIRRWACRRRDWRRAPSRSIRSPSASPASG